MEIIRNFGKMLLGTTLGSEAMQNVGNVSVAAFEPLKGATQSMIGIGILSQASDGFKLKK